MDRFDLFTLSFFREAYRPMLEYRGTHSGRDENKSEGAGLTPLETPRGEWPSKRPVWFWSAQDLLSRPGPQKLRHGGDFPYPQEDYHRLYIGKVDGSGEALLSLRAGINFSPQGSLEVLLVQSLVEGLVGEIRVLSTSSWRSRSWNAFPCFSVCIRVAI